MIVIGILGILVGIVFVAVPQYQRGMTKLEFDNFAKEIFVAAQNHLAMAESEDYLGVDGFGYNDGEADVFYFDVNGDHQFGRKTMLDLMLPFGSVDEDVRTGGRYIVRYHKAAAQILDVFFWKDGDSRFGHTYDSRSDYAKFKAARANSAALKTYEGDNAVIGYYGGVDARTLTRGDLLKIPEIKVDNAETLSVKIDDRENHDNPKACVKLIITGVKSGQQREIPIYGGGLRTESEWTEILDDLGGSRHFYQRFCGPELSPSGEPRQPLIPGEDIEIQAIVYNNQELTNIAYSAKVVTNSLFAAATELDDDNWRADIGYLRHLENLDKTVSQVQLNYTSARQVRDLDYTKLKAVFPEGKVNITKAGGSALTTESFYPVKLPEKFSYNGQRHSVANVEINHSGVVGLFSELTKATVQDLKLLDFTVTGETAGALAGSVTDGKISNVLAKHDKNGDEKILSVTGTENAGGLIGSVSASTSERCAVSKCAAALVVESTGDGGSAGGLIGTTGKDVTVTACYSGGHTADGRYYDADGAIYNVKGSTAGGLIGSAGEADVTACYSTCSVYGATAGGFVGSGDYTNCYATGLVGGGTVGAFAGRYSGTASGCLYFEIINVLPVESNPDNGYTYLGPVNGEPYDEITRLDENTGIYASFTENVGKSDHYDDGLDNQEFRLKTIPRMTAVEPGDYVNTHYGDWPVPAVQVQP